MITSTTDTDDLSTGFDRDRDRRQRELTEKNIKGKYLLRFMLKDIFGFLDHQEKAIFGLDYKLTLTGNTDKAVLNKDNATNKAKIRSSAIEWYVPHYTPSVSKQAKLSEQNLSRTPTELQYVKRSVFMKEVDNQNSRTFEFETQEGINVPIWIIVGFQQRNRQDSQNINNDTFYRPPVTSAQCIIGTKKYPDSGIFSTCDDDDSSQGYGQIKEPFKILTKDDILQAYKPDNDFRSSSNGDIIAYKLYVFDIRYQKKMRKCSTNYSRN